MRPHEPDLVWYAGEHGPDDVIRMMRRAGRELIVATLDTIAPRVADRNRVIDEVLGAGSFIVDIAAGARLGPECREAVMAALGARRRDLSPEDAQRAGRAGGQRGYDVTELEACKPQWIDKTIKWHELQAATGIHPSTLWRYFMRDRAVKVPRGGMAGRPPKQ